ncbi:DNA mismatch repair endonuclease MutL [Halobellus ruber]|uniref:DNA mismatch repair protein MutL n=1 Tax=Halobellus ruber TaxID=2761102 RepID=A0A7J9SJH0_9EURY|nr:DNA mismatch repair endonuclease MutL [Halobellus ruber]MBB6647094.1 DNA mismatch repair endonuclease MutL [Halobellus ruber]
MSDEHPAPAADRPVRRLDEATVASVAAGEVVTRPADVVVELVENALDAGASRIDIDIAGDGTERISVRDDGRGMDRSDAELAVERHTTSKLDPGGSVETAETLGFRGEALASVATVADLELVTNDGGPRGTRVVATGGPGADRVEAAGRGRGTTVTVRDLFADTPARRASLSTARTEFARVSDAVSRYAVARPDVGFSLAHDGSGVFSTPGTGEYADALLGVYDRKVASRTTAFDATAGLGTDAPGNGDGPADVRLRGTLVQPSITRARRDHIYVDVGGRPVRNGRLRRAVVDGYGDRLPDGRAPVAAASVSVPDGWADHNVHPRKREVRLRAPDAVADAVESAVADALSTADRRRSEDLSMDLDGAVEPFDPGDTAFAEADFVGQFRGLYLLCAFEGDLLVVDQHAAHERINYERLREAVGDDPPTAPIDPPATVSVTPAQYAAADSHRDALADLGYDVDPFDGSAVRVRSVPAPLSRPADPESVRDAIDALQRGETPDDGRDDSLKDLACHPSLKAGDDLTDAEADALLDRLGACENPYNCPHGRPTVLTVAEETLVRGFDRRNTRLE